MGAVNCVVNRDGKFIGENTDGKGFVSSLKEIEDPNGKSVVVGAGGASRAIGVEMALSGVTHLTIVNRSEERGRGLVDLLRGRVKSVALAWRRNSFLGRATSRSPKGRTSLSMRPPSGCIQMLMPD